MKEKSKEIHHYEPETVPAGERGDHRVYPSSPVRPPLDESENHEGLDVKEEERQSEWKYLPDHRRPPVDESSRQPTKNSNS